MWEYDHKSTSEHDLDSIKACLAESQPKVKASLVDIACSHCLHASYFARVITCKLNLKIYDY